MPFHRVQIRQDGKCKGRARIEPHAAFRQAHRRGPEFACTLYPSKLDALHHDRGEIGACDGKRRIERNGFLEQADRGFVVCFGLAIIVGKPLQELIPGGQILRRRPGWGGSFRTIDLRGYRGGQAGGDLILHREQIADVPVISAVPYLLAALRRY